VSGASILVLRDYLGSFPFSFGQSFIPWPDVFVPRFRIVSMAPTKGTQNKVLVNERRDKRKLGVRLKQRKRLVMQTKDERAPPDCCLRRSA